MVLKGKGKNLALEVHLVGAQPKIEKYVNILKRMDTQGKDSALLPVSHPTFCCLQLGQVGELWKCGCCQLCFHFLLLVGEH